MKRLAEQLHRLIVSNEGKTTPQIKRIITRMKTLVRELRQRISSTDLRKVLGATALFFGLAGQQVNAQNFQPPITNPYGLQQANYIAACATADLDNDGDIDVLIGEYYGGLIYYENTGSAQIAQFAAPATNPFGLDSVDSFAFPTFADLDNDGDMDLLVGEYNGNFKYFRNNGTANSPAFGTPISNPFSIQPAYYFGLPSFADLDNDGDLDLLIGEYYGNMQYYENIGTPTTASFDAPQTNPFGLSQTYEYAFIDLGDLDNDGDFDLIVGEYYGAFQYFENTGTVSNPQFSGPQTNPFGLDSVYSFAIPEFIDMDGDGDLDLLVGAYYGSINYYENADPQAIKEEQAGFELTLFPNPVQDVLQITSEDKITQIELLDLSGRVINIQQNVNNTIRVAHLPKGLYILRLTNDSGLATTEKFEKL